MQASDSNSIPVDIHDLASSALRLLHDYLIAPDPKDARARFEKLRQRTSHTVAEMPSERSSPIEVSLSLDDSEFVGVLDFHGFRHFLSHLLGVLSQAQENNEQLPLREEQAGRRYIITIPAALEIASQMNVLMLGFDLQQSNQLRMELLFFEPSQFQEVDKLAKT